MTKIRSSAPKGVAGARTKFASRADLVVVIVAAGVVLIIMPVLGAIWPEQTWLPGGAEIATVALLWVTYRYVVLTQRLVELTSASRSRESCARVLGVIHDGSHAVRVISRYVKDAPKANAEEVNRVLQDQNVHKWYEAANEAVGKLNKTLALLPREVRKPVSRYRNALVRHNRAYLRARFLSAEVAGTKSTAGSLDDIRLLWPSRRLRGVGKPISSLDEFLEGSASKRTLRASRIATGSIADHLGGRRS
jgi:hypothetical protein